MENYNKYLPTSELDNKWGMTLLNVGCGQIYSTDVYPAAKHPEAYEFKWQNGRILREYQLIYISQGKGIFESGSSGPQNLEGGTIILLFPGEWHRYRPDPSTGWVEYWAGFKGHLADSVVGSSLFDRRAPLIVTGAHPDIISLYEGIMAHTRSELPGYQPLVAGMVVHLLGLVFALSRQRTLTDERGDQQQLVQKAKVLIRELAQSKTAIQEVAAKLQTGYSHFRKIFKKHTGLAPGQYLNQLKIERAKSLLLYSDKRVKEIAYELNFESENYFSKFFRQKTGLSPLAFKQAYCVTHANA